MIEAILIDDEKLPLEKLANLLKKNSNIDVVGMFQDPLHALKEITENVPDVVFLDIQMPEISGLELADRIQEFHEEIEIVFVTGYDHYAIDAFELFALDYLIKPIQTKRLEKTIRRIDKKNLLNRTSNNRNKQIQLSCFNEIKFSTSENAEIPIKWRTRKTLELFAYLLHNREKFVSKETLIDMLWSELPIDKAYQQLYTTIYHCRNSLKKANISDVLIRNVSNIGSGYMLQTGGLIVHECYEWRLGSEQISFIDKGQLGTIEKLFYQYAGDYLGYYDFHWARTHAERLRQQWLKLGRLLAAYYQKKREYSQAITIYSTVQNISPELEESYFELMKLFAIKKEYREVHIQYQDLTNMLVEELDIEPSTEITNWYFSWKERNSINNFYD
ncbi:response regulator [Gracilibacillus massiliensis]|uniref:response regulator n=1 Tax=Gracilibacillus massiliensis TaxID=1564956 RepID=UPI00071D6909|nr:response regulator [Gracilibacillus massiliensis]